MFASFQQLRAYLRNIIANKSQQGHIVLGLQTELDALPDSYDALHAFAQKLNALPLRDDWTYNEPDDLEGIWAQCDPQRPRGVFREIKVEDATRRIESAFLSSICGCVLGKPIEVDPTLAELRDALEQHGAWPLNDYVEERVLNTLGRRHDESWRNTTRGHINFVEPDDDINYTLLGMLALEKYGTNFTRANLHDLWLHHLVIDTTWGPERTVLAKASINAMSYGGENDASDFDSWVNLWNAGDELCGAPIRADAYGYACPGRPELAAKLAWRDAGFTHRKTGIYATLWTAVAIAVAPVAKTPLEIFQVALQFVPQNSRFYKIVSDSLNEVAQSSDWLDGYNRIHGKYKEYSNCQIYQESGTLINTLHWAQNVGDGFCKQVMQGNDTDSYGATAGSILGAYFGPGHLEDRWLAPFNDDIHTGLAWFYERSLSALAKRAAQLPLLTLSA